MLFKVVTSTHAVKYINLANVTSVTVTPKVDSGIRRITFWFGAAPTSPRTARGGVASMRWALFAAVLAAGCGKGETTTGANAAKPERSALAGRVELEELAANYRTNEAKADDLYGNRRVTVEGAMKKLTKTESGYFMSFEHGANVGSELPVVAYFPAGAASDLAKLEFRSPVLFSGRCDGWEKNTLPRAVAIRDCKLEPWPKGGAVTAPPKVEPPKVP